MGKKTTFALEETQLSFQEMRLVLQTTHVTQTPSWFQFTLKMSFQELLSLPFKIFRPMKKFSTHTVRRTLALVKLHVFVKVSFIV